VKRPKKSYKVLVLVNLIFIEFGTQKNTKSIKLRENRKLKKITKFVSNLFKYRKTNMWVNLLVQSINIMKDGTSE